MKMGAKAPEWSFEALRARGQAIEALLRLGHALAELQTKTDAELRAMLDAERSKGR